MSGDPPSGGVSSQSRTQDLVLQKLSKKVMPSEDSRSVHFDVLELNLGPPESIQYYFASGELVVK